MSWVMAVLQSQKIEWYEAIFIPLQTYDIRNIHWQLRLKKFLLDNLNIHRLQSNFVYSQSPEVFIFVLK